MVELAKSATFDRLLRKLKDRRAATQSTLARATGSTSYRYDSADYLEGAEDVAALLEAAIEEGGDDPAFITRALGTIARSGNLSELARKAGMSREGLYKALTAEGNPSFATIVKVARALGLRLHFQAVT